ncbi:MAG: hypothetical protein J0H12_00500 [Candidatus Paracaedimonas acanthamoebae]|uniref:ATP synthase subunit b n=1 Tax=Candidatus Paracaedimonas acanthamoebae TaxID=244581 RepID=A0A8J7PPI5_9PROT|nr:hypothetical protein [Candidatus Paracaedimonas acanthamoebae]
MPQLEITTYLSQLFWLVICFAIIFLFSWRISLPRLTALLHQRWEQIEGQKKLAGSLRAEAEILRQAQEKTLEKARHQAKEIMIQTDHKIKLSFEQERIRLSSTMREKIKVTEAHLHQKKEQISKEMPEIVRQLTHEIIKKALNSSDSSQLIIKEKKSDA